MFGTDLAFWIGGHYHTVDGELAYERPRCSRCGMPHDGKPVICRNCGAYMRGANKAIEHTQTRAAAARQLRIVMQNCPGEAERLAKELGLPTMARTDIFQGRN